MSRDGAFVATILCDAREEEMEENMEQVLQGIKQGQTVHKTERERYRSVRCDHPKGHQGGGDGGEHGSGITGDQKALSKTRTICP